MSDASHIFSMISSSNDDYKALKKAVDTGVRGLVKVTVRTLIDKCCPAFSWAVDIVVDFIFDYFGW
jgi:hypothetical protein